MAPPSASSLHAAREAARQRWADLDAPEREAAARRLAAAKPKGADGAFKAQAALAGRPRLPLALGKQLTVYALRQLSRLALARSFVRDLHVTAGNFCAHWDDTDAAFAHYRAAADGERDYQRLALARLNLAKLHMTTGQPHEGLDILRRLDAARLEDARVAVSVRLVAGRAYLLFGYTSAANAVMAGFRGKVPGPPVAIEYRYLALMSRARVDDLDGFAKRLADFQAKPSEDAAPFYEMEALLFHLVVDRKAIRNREHAMIRAAYLKKRTGMTRLYRLIRLVDAALAPRGLNDRQRPELVRVARSLLASDHALSVRFCLMGTCLRLLEANKTGVAALVYDILCEHAGFVLGPLLLRRSSLPADNRIVDDLERLAGLFPKEERPALDGFDWLMRAT